VENGVIEAALFHRCVDKFDLTVEIPPGTQSILDSDLRMIPFTESAILFRLHREGINFWADQKWFNALMYQASPVIDRPTEWIVRLPPHRRTVTYHELMSIFVSDGAPTVPLTTGTQSLLQHVPIP
jgi:hypothetical protein